MLRVLRRQYPDGACTRRDYTFDNNTNRTALAVAISDVGAACTSTGPTATSYSYDSADRLVTSCTVCDAFGRTTTHASGATIGYYANDLVRQQTSGTSQQTWALDAGGRLATWTTETQSGGTWTRTGSKPNHYGADGDNPDWTQETSTTLTRNVQDLSGDLGTVTSATGDTVLTAPLPTARSAPAGPVARRRRGSGPSRQAAGRRRRSSLGAGIVRRGRRASGRARGRSPHWVGKARIATEANTGLLMGTTIFLPSAEGHRRR